jgi:hypothetical protein
LNVLYRNKNGSVGLVSSGQPFLVKQNGRFEPYVM